MNRKVEQFERLIRLEDEELVSDDATEGDASDSCRVPMMPTSENSLDTSTNLENIFRHSKHKSFTKADLPGVQFVINGRQIRMSPEQLKYVSLITLTIQNAALNLVMRAARTQKDQFSTAIAVTLAEILKLVTCIALLLYEEVTVERTLKSIKDNVATNYMDTLKVAVPSFVYYVQNNLIYVGSTHLDAATSQVTYQLKILTTAIFSVTMLNKKLTKLQWTSLVVLFIGVALIETVAVTNHDNKLTTPPSTITTNVSTTADQELKPLRTSQRRHEKPLIGFIAILIACCLSGFAGVYFEKILKDTANVSLWIRNIQLSVVAIPIGLMQVILTENEHISTKGLFYGFTPMAWLCIVLQAQGGLLVALVVKFANNILKGFATSMAIVISTVASIFIFDFELTPSFVFGASLVISSVMMYNKQ
uniref:UDP-galactose translocator n=1 Tax=Aceria tosichella TaxID=561515 RepID=A0A6G1SQD6_9ACAR